MNRTENFFRTVFTNILNVHFTHNFFFKSIPCLVIESVPELISLLLLEIRVQIVPLKMDDSSVKTRTGARKTAVDIKYKLPGEVFHFRATMATNNKLRNRVTFLPAYHPPTHHCQQALSKPSVAISYHTSADDCWQIA